MTTAQLPWPRSADDGTPLGVDLGRPREQGRPVAALEVRRLVASSLRRRPVPLDLDDVVQEVCLAIVRRNHTPSALDPRKSGFAHYVVILCGNVVGHMLERRERSRKERPFEELPEVAADELDTQERFEAAEALHAPPSDLWAVALQARAVSGPQLFLLGLEAATDEPEREHDPCDTSWLSEPQPEAQPPTSRQRLRQSPRGVSRRRQLDLFEVP